MKALYKILFLLVFLPAVGQAQFGLMPKLYASGTDTAFCFNRYQIKEVAKLIAKGYYSEQTVEKQKQLIANLETKMTAKDLIIRNQYEQLSIQQTDLAGKDSLISMYQIKTDFQALKLDEKEKIIVTQKVNQKWIIRGGITLTIISFVVGAFSR